MSDVIGTLIGEIFAALYEAWCRSVLSEAPAAHRAPAVPAPAGGRNDPLWDRELDGLPSPSE
jgi:hypothetical protein